MMLLCTGMMDHLLGGQAVRPHASREDAAITEEPGAATAFMLDEDFHGEDTAVWCMHQIQRGVCTKCNVVLVACGTNQMLCW